MPGYTKKNLKEVKNMAPPEAAETGFEGRFARGELDCERSGMTYFRYGPNGRTPFGHRHEEQEEIYVLLSGSARVKIDEDIVELEPLDAVRIAHDSVRAVEAGPDGAEIVAFGAGRGGREEAEIIPGWWSD